MPFFDSIRTGASGAAADYEVQRSLRINKDDNAVLTRSPSSTTNSTKQTLSFWFKISSLLTSDNQGIMFAGGSDGSWAYAQFFQGTFYFGNSAGPYWMGNLTLRDFTAWYHAVIVIDTTQSTANDRQKLYINGVQQERGSGSNPSQDSNYEYLTNSSWTYYIGKRGTNDFNFHGYLAEINFVQGLAYDSSYFGETNAETGQWVPKKYTGSYGTNGFYLNFSDNSNNTATTLGKDSSGNGNNWTPSNLATSDSVTDTPTNNFPTWNPLSTRSLPTLSEGNLKNAGDNNSACNATFGVTSGKWYWEIHVLTDVSTTAYIAATGVTAYQMELEGDSVPRLSYDSSLRSWYRAVTSGGIYAYKRYTDTNGTEISSGGTFYGGTVISFRLDMDNGSLKFYTNNTLVHTDTTIPTDGTVIFPMQNATNSGTTRHNSSIINFGQDGTFAGTKTAQGNTDENGIGNFFYSVPSGHKAICSKNLSDPTIKLPDKHFDITLYTGNNSSQEISTLNFQPDWLWFKNRGGTNWHGLFDSVRGRGQGVTSNNTNTEYTSSASNDLVSFDDDGFTLGSNQNWGSVNGSSNNIVTWAWNGGGTDAKTYKVKVVADSTDYGHGTGSNKYQFFKSDGTTGFGTNGVDLDLEEGGTYVFDWSDSSAQGHPLRFSLTNDGTHSNGTSAGTEYTTGVTKDDSAYKTTITIASGVANLYYYCQNHSGMGAEIATSTTKGSTNFDGSIVSVAKANTTAGFSIVTWSIASDAVYTIGHGLGVAPKAIFMKARNQTTNWDVFHASIGNTKRIKLNSRDAAETQSGVWNNTSPTSTVFTNTGSWLNGSGTNVVAYVFSEVAGYSSFGSYTGTGESSGPYVFLGFRPAWILVKADLSESWYIWDKERDTFNAVDTELRVDEAYAETTFTLGDFTSSGFKIRQTDSALNQNGATYVYFAFAESPFKNARAR